MLCSCPAFFCRITDTHDYRTPSSTRHRSKHRLFGILILAPRSPTHLCSRRSHRLCWTSGCTRRWSGSQDGERFGIPVGCYFPDLGQTYRYLRLDDGYLGVFGNRTLSWEWARSCWDGSARAGGWRCRYLVFVLSPKASWYACLRHFIWDDHIRI